MTRVPFTMFGVTRMVPLVIYERGERVHDPEPRWDATLFAGRGEDYYALTGRSSRTLVVDRSDWINSPEVIEGQESRP